MTLGEYYSRGITMEDVLEDAHDRIIGRLAKKTSTADCERLEKYFNDLFYPKDNVKTSSAAIKNLITQAYQYKYDLALNDFDIGGATATYGATLNSLPSLIRDKYESFHQTEKIYVATIEKRLRAVEEALSKVTNINELNKINSDLLELKTLLTSLLDYKTSNSDSKGAYFKLDGDDSLVTQVRKMNALYETVAQVGGVFTPGDYGSVLEWTLQAFSNQSNDIIEQYTDKLLDEEILKKVISTAGTDLTSSNAIKIKMAPITLDGKFVKKDSQTKEFEIGSGKGKFSFKAVGGFNPNSDRQGKMDVYFEFNDQEKITPFRISAKNWAILDRDLGATNIAYALIRSLEMDNALAYAYTLQDERPGMSSERKTAHKVANYAILADILMGYSQAGNYADTLFLNIREEKRVAVFSISDIADKINANLNSFEVSGYSSADIYGKMVKIRKALGKTGRSNEYETLSLKYLQATQVRLQYANLAKFL